MEANGKKCSGSLCSNTEVMHRPEPLSPEDQQKKKPSLGDGSSSRSMKTLLSALNVGGGLVSCNSSYSYSLSVSCYSPSISGSFRVMPFRKLSGCYECRMVVDPVLGFTRYPSLRATICSCPECGEVFMKAENLELHQAVRHAVCKLQAVAHNSCNCCVQRAVTLPIMCVAIIPLCLYILR